MNFKIAEKNIKIVEQKVNCHAKVLAQLLWVSCVLDRVIHIFSRHPEVGIYTRKQEIKKNSKKNQALDQESDQKNDQETKKVLG